ncbi:dihydrofolate reductase family protein [Pseudomonas sp. KSR10]|uniref:dihydrofolate reductase family protein n=1 Tax=Pseudomonadaceae TaxID=135621 RepID=UPI0005EB29E2|nr:MULTISPECIES: dihydrofolate reductase family protein [Pseudomonadaceae]MCG6541442.1 dihydrofolate reductase family protein [Pseudomonas sp. KSR10]
MRKIIAITHVTLDGIMQAPGGPEEDPRYGFLHGGWVMPFWDDALGQAIGEILSGEFDMLLGRRTYEIFAAYWPYAGDNYIATAFNKAIKYVATCSLEKLEWNNSLVINCDVMAGIRRLKATEGPEVHIWGSGELLQSLIAAELIDEYRLWIFPLMLGGGKRLFEQGVPPRSLTLVDTHSTPKGVLISTYRPAGPLALGATEADTPSAAELARREKIAGEETDAYETESPKG